MKQNKFNIYTKQIFYMKLKDKLWLIWFEGDMMIFIINFYDMMKCHNILINNLSGNK